MYAGVHCAATFVRWVEMEMAIQARVYEISKSRCRQTSLDWIQITKS